MLAVGAGVVMSPWIIRNYVLVHQFVPTATVAGVAAQEGLYTCENAASGRPVLPGANEGRVRAGRIRQAAGDAVHGPLLPTVLHAA